MSILFFKQQQVQAQFEVDMASSNVTRLFQNQVMFYTFGPNNHKKKVTWVVGNGWSKRDEVTYEADQIIFEAQEDFEACPLYDGLGD